MPTLKLGGPRVDAVAVVGTPVGSFKLALESVTISVLGEPPSVNVAEMEETRDEIMWTDKRLEWGAPCDE